MSRLGETWRFEDLEAEVMVVGGISIHVATRNQIDRMKKDTERERFRETEARNSRA